MMLDGAVRGFCRMSVIVLLDGFARSSIVGFDANTGSLKWEIARPPFRLNYATPSPATPARAALPCLALIALFPAWAGAQTLTPDMLRPVRGGFVSPEELPLRRTAPERPSEGIPDPAAESRQRQPELPAPTRVGQIPTYGLPAANGAAASGYDSLNRKRQKPKYYPAQVRPKPPAGPGSPPPPLTAPLPSG